MSRCPKLSLIALGLAVAILGGIAAFGFWVIPDEWTKRPSPELQQFFGQCAKVRPDMTKDQIAELFADYPSVWTEELAELPPRRGPVTRPATLAKLYYSISNPREVRYCIVVYYDKDSRVVGKQMEWASE